MATILIVDDFPENIDLIKTLFSSDPYKFISAQNGPEAIKQVKRHRPDLVLLDVVMPGMDGFQVCEKLKNNKETMLTPVVMVTGLDDSKSRLRGIEAGVDDFISKPLNMFELKVRVKSLLRIKEYNDQLEYAERIMFSLALVVEAKDPNTKGHCNRLANYGALLGERVGLSANEIQSVRRGGILHDIGKLAIQDDILLKPGPLSNDEFDVIKTHPAEGEKICRPLKTLEDVLPIIRYHQERYNGSGYPEGLIGDEIPLPARIVAMVDSYDALTTDRPYRKALSKKDALNILDRETAEGQWDKNLYEEFKEVLAIKNLNEIIDKNISELVNLN